MVSKTFSDYFDLGKRDYKLGYELSDCFYYHEAGDGWRAGWMYENRNRIVRERAQSLPKSNTF